MDFLFCCHPRKVREADPDYVQEVRCVATLGATSHFVDHDALLEGDVSRALRGIEPQGDTRFLCYRGWMIPPSSYTALYNGLRDRDFSLINQPEQYQHCHYLPESYDAIRDMTPETIWLQGQPPFDADEVMSAIQVFSGKPLILKDYVKSQKHYWQEACFIPDSTNRDAVISTVERFIELQGDQVEGGLVFREYVPIKIIGEHPVSGMPLSHEYRVVWFDQNPVAVWPYWDASDTTQPLPSVEPFREAATRIDSRFFTMDIAELEDGSWIIVELGDAQVAGLPENADAVTLYQPMVCA